MTVLDLATLAAALGAALIAGTFFAFSSFIMRALAERPPAEGAAAMVAINRVILRSLFMPVFIGSVVLDIALTVWAMIAPGPASPWLIAGAAAYVLGTFGVTMWKNVPLNNALDRAPDEALWRDYLARWTLWNHVRTAASLAATGLFIAALVA